MSPADETSTIVETAERWPDVDYDFSLSQEQQQELELYSILSLIHQDGIWSDFPPVSGRDAEMAVVVDLDRDIVSQFVENAFEWSHYPLRNVPETVFMSRTDAIKLELPPPTLGQELSSLYDSYSPSVFDYTQLIPNSNHARRELMKKIIRRHCHPYVLFGTEGDVLEQEWRASNTAFRKAVQAIVLFSSWDLFQLIPIPRDERVSRLDYSGEKFTNLDDPNSDMYIFHDGLNNKIMLHISTHLEHDYKYAVGRVIKYAKKMATTGHFTACILSLAHIVVVKVDGEGDKYNVSHTQPIPLFYCPQHGDGLGLLISVLSSATRTAPGPYLETALPREILDRIFQEYCFCDGMANILNWRLACKAFNQVADQWIISLAPLSVLNFSAPEIRPRLWYARDEVGNLGVWGPWDIFDCKRKLRYRAINRQTGKAIGSYIFEIYQRFDTDTEDMIRDSWTSSDADSEESDSEESDSEESDSEESEEY
jgi:hypothetical protein